MTDQVDNWHKLARYDTNMQGELHANLLRNNGIEVSLQPLSALPGLNSGVVLWVQDTDLNDAKRILDNIDTDNIDNDSTIVLDDTLDRSINNATSSRANQDGNI